MNALRAAATVMYFIATMAFLNMVMKRQDTRMFILVGIPMAAIATYLAYNAWREFKARRQARIDAITNKLTGARRV